MTTIWRAATLMVAALPLLAQAPPASTMGTLTAFRPEAAELEIKADNGSVFTVKIAADTIFRRVQPGEKSLKNAEEVHVTDLSTGDRVLVTKAPDGVTARRVIVISAKSISSRDEAERKDWNVNGVGGVVDSKKGDEIILRSRSMSGQNHTTVVAGPNTKFRRYAAGSVKFSDAKESSLAEVSAGDQLRARGKKSADGQRVEAEEVVFGTFLTRAGTVLSADPETKEIKIKDNADEKTLTVKVTPDSQLKRMPAFGGMRSGAAGAAGEQGGRPGGSHDIAQMLEHMPAAQFQDIHPGETIVVSSTKGANPGQLTAIMLLTNAESLVRMAARQPAGQAGASGRGMGAGGMGGMSGMGGFGGSEGMGGIELPGMLP